MHFILPFTLTCVQIGLNSFQSCVSSFLLLELAFFPLTVALHQPFFCFFNSEGKRIYKLCDRTLFLGAFLLLNHCVC